MAKQDGLEKKVIDLNNLEKLINESVAQSIKETFGQNLSHEKLVQDLTSSEIEDLQLKASRKKSKDSDEDMEEQEDVNVDINIKDKKKEPNKAKVKVVDELPQKLDVADIAKTLNIIRSGKSLKDPEVYERFTQYYGSLSAPEKIALKGFMDGLAQVIAGNVEGTDAAEPSKPPYNVKMDAEPIQKGSPKAGTEKLNKTISKVSRNVPSGTDSPIIVGEHADKSNLLRILREMK